MLEVLALDLPQAEFEKELEQMKMHIYASPIEEPTLKLTRHQEPRSRIISNLSIMRIAAVIVSAIAVIAAVILSTSKSDQTEPAQEVANRLISKQNSNGQKSQLQLSDGSIVHLNSGSEIEFLENFSENSRTVKLKGEAFFEVAHNAKKSFIVSTDELDIIALGTSFNVRAFGESETVTVALVEGKVEVNVKEQEVAKKSLLEPGQGLLFDKKSQSIQLEQFDPRLALAWKKGVLSFENASWQEIITSLERWYDVEFTVKNAPIRESPFTGEFDNLSLELVLESLSFTKDFEHQIEGKKVEIKFNQ